jgi:hypothetical protein
MRPEGVRRSRSRTVVRLVGLRIWICRIVTSSSRVSSGNGHADAWRVRWRDGATLGRSTLAPSKGSRRCTCDPPLLGVERDDSRCVAVGPVGRCARGRMRTHHAPLGSGIGSWCGARPGGRLGRRTVGRSAGAVRGAAGLVVEVMSAPSTVRRTITVRGTVAERCTVGKCLLSRDQRGGPVTGRASPQNKSSRPHASSPTGTVQTR